MTGNGTPAPRDNINRKRRQGFFVKVGRLLQATSVNGGSNPPISTIGSYICTKSCVIQVLVRKRKTNYGDSYHEELEETDRILLARGPKIWGRVIHSGRGISMKDRWMDAHRQVGSIPTYSTKRSLKQYTCI